MGIQFDERIDKAVEILWVKQDEKRAKEAFALLEELVEEGNGDACFFLARCYFGECYVNPEFGLTEDDKRGEAYLEKSMELGSAVGMFGAMRVGGFEPKRGTFIYPPYSSYKELWSAVLEKVSTGTSAGQLFCKYMIANAYYYGDVMELMELPEEQVDGKKIQLFMYEAARLYEECLKEGFSFGLNNVLDIFESGDYVPKDEEKAWEIRQLAADLHITKYELMIGEKYLEENLDKAEEYFKRAAEHGDVTGYYKLTNLYTFDGKRPLDLKKAKEYAEAGVAMEPNTVGCNNLLGQICFRGGEGVSVDYYKAVECFEKVIEENNWGANMLGTCYLQGLGTEKNPKRALELFQKRSLDELSILGLGEIYCFGLGVRQNIKEGMKYLDKLPNHPRVIKMKSHFKKSLFGGWKQID